MEKRKDFNDEQNLQFTKMHLMVKATNIGLWDMKMKGGDPSDPDNEFVFSDEFRKLLGFENENDFPNKFKSQVSCMHPSVREHVLDTFRKHVLDKTGQTPYDLEYRMIKKNGEIGFFRDVGETLRDAQGNPLHTAGALMDVTEKWNDALAKEQQLSKIHMLVHAAGLAMWDVDLTYENPENPALLFKWSNEFRLMLGYENEDDFPNEMSSLDGKIFPGDNERVWDAFYAHVNDKTGNTPFDIEFRIKRKSGEYIFVHNTAETIRDADGNALFISGAMRDITALKDMVLEMDEQRRAAEAANLAKSAFLSTMSHEIRTPMNAILGITEIQLMNPDLSEEARESYEKIYTSGDLLLSIINDILDLSKIEAGKLELQNAKYEIASLLSDTSQLNMMRIGSKPIEFELHVDENLPSYLIGDELRIKQVLNNILSNAFKYTESGAVKMTVTSQPSTSAGEELLSLSVSDTGQGMSEQQVKKLFDKYSRFNTEANRTTEGTGLGMNITKNLVSLMRGKIVVNSKPGEGSEFIVTLPQQTCGIERLGKESAENLQQFRTRSRAQMRRVQITRDPMPYGKILIVDDVETNIYVAKGLMTAYHLNIDSVNSGISAIERVKNGKEYDIIFMDHMMPQMDGIEATKHIRDSGYKLPIVALTANAVSGQEKVFLEAGFDGFISKPIDVRQLNKVLNTFVRDRHSPETVEAARQNAAAGKAQKSAAEYAPSGRPADPKFAALFIRDSSASLAVLEETFRNGISKGSDSLRSFTIHIHGMGTVLAAAGKPEAAKLAKTIENCCRDENIDLINKLTPVFLEILRDIIQEVSEYAKTAESREKPADSEDDKPFLQKMLTIIKTACENYDDDAIQDALTELESKTWSNETENLITRISECLLISEFDDIVKEIDEYEA